MMRWIDKLMGLDGPPPPPRYDFAAFRTATRQVIDQQIQEAMPMVLQSFAELVEEKAISDRDLAMVQGKLKEDDPDLSHKIGELRRVLRNCRENTDA